MNGGRRLTVGKIVGVVTALVLAVSCGSSSTKTGSKAVGGAAAAKSSASNTTVAAGDAPATARSGKAFCDDLRELQFLSVDARLGNIVAGDLDDVKRQAKDVAQAIAKHAPPKVAAAANSYAVAFAAAVGRTTDLKAVGDAVTTVNEARAKEHAAVNEYFNTNCL